MVKTISLKSLPDLKLIKLVRHEDRRGFFLEAYNQKAFSLKDAKGAEVSFVQDNHSLSRRAGTLRGMHFQLPPVAQAKLVRVVKGAILDVVVDIRRGSPSFGCHERVVLSAAQGDQLFVPIGFAHGFLTLEPDTEVIYKVSNYYSAEHDAGILWNDPVLGIDWQVDTKSVILSEKDKKQPRLAEIPQYFNYPAH